MKHRNQISKLFLLVPALALGLGACSNEAQEQDQAAGSAADAAAEPAEGQEAGGMEGMGQAPHGDVSQVTFECADGEMFSLTVASGVSKAALRLADGEIHQLDQVEVASGMEFSDGVYTFRGMGPEASVEKDGEPLLSGCTATGHPQ